MSFKLIITTRFESELKRLAKKFPSLKNEFSDLVSSISKNPSHGTSIGNNCYKIRMAIASKGKGKRGGARVITHLYLSSETIYMLTIYDKSEKSDLKPSELNEMINSLNLG